MAILNLLCCTDQWLVFLASRLLLSHNPSTGVKLLRLKGLSTRLPPRKSCVISKSRLPSAASSRSRSTVETSTTPTPPIPINTIRQKGSNTISSGERCGSRSARRQRWCEFGSTAALAHCSGSARHDTRGVDREVSL